MREQKPRAYMEHKVTGWIMGLPEVKWIAYDKYGSAITWSDTRKDCENECRRYGYVPVRSGR